MNVEVTGKVYKIYEPVQSGKFTRNEIVIETDGKFGLEYLKVELSNSIVDEAGYSVGDDVNCKVDVKGIKYEKDGEERFFTALKCWRMEVMGSKPKKKQIAESVIEEIGFTPDDDLPF